MEKCRLEALLIKVTFFVSMAAFMMCAGISVQSAFMAKKAREAVDSYAKVQGENVDRCLPSDAVTCVLILKSVHEPEYAELSSQDYEERMERYGVAAVLLPFLILTVFFAGQWITTGKTPLSYGTDEQS